MPADFAMLASIENSVSKKQACLTLLGIKSNHKAFTLIVIKIVIKIVLHK
jgi:hypothetical protein